MSVDYQRAWQITEKSRMDGHDPECSWRVTGYLLCDCDVLEKHPETLDTKHLYTKDGKIYVDKRKSLLVNS